MKKDTSGQVIVGQVVVGQFANLQDRERQPGQNTACRIAAPSAKGPEWVIVEWLITDAYHERHEALTVRLSQLRF